MFAKGIGGTLYLMLLGAVLAISALPAAAQNPQSTATPSAQAAQGYVAATSTNNVGSGKREVEFSGNISKIDADQISVIGSDGAETVVQLAPGTKIRGRGNGRRAHLMATGASSSSDRAALVVGLPVEVEAHRGPCDCRLTAESIKFRFNPCLCHAYAERGSPASNTK